MSQPIQKFLEVSNNTNSLLIPGGTSMQLTGKTTKCSFLKNQYITTKDRHFVLICSHIPALKLYDSYSNNRDLLSSNMYVKHILFESRFPKNSQLHKKMFLAESLQNFENVVYLHISFCFLPQMKLSINVCEQ